MDLPDLPQGDQLASTPAARLYPMAVDPTGRIGVPAYLQVFAQLFVADCPPLAKELLDLLENEGVPLDGGRMMGLLQPYATPDPLRLFRRGESPEAVAKLSDLNSQAFVDRLPRGSPPAAVRIFVRLGQNLNVQNKFIFLFGSQQVNCSEQTSDTYSSS